MSLCSELIQPHTGLARPTSQAEIQAHTGVEVVKWTYMIISDFALGCGQKYWKYSQMPWAGIHSSDLDKTGQYFVAYIFKSHRSLEIPFAHFPMRESSVSLLAGRFPYPGCRQQGMSSAVPWEEEKGQQGNSMSVPRELWEYQRSWGIFFPLLREKMFGAVVLKGFFLVLKYTKLWY